MNGPLAVFRCDASPQIGSGHVVRCLTLADALAAAGWTCIFASAGATRATVPLLAASRHRQLALTDPQAEPAQLAAAVPTGCDLLVVDHYRRDDSFESACRPWARRVLALDDLADRRHDCELLLDPTVGRETGSYAALVPARCRLLLGPAYALLRPQFLAARRAAQTKRAARQTAGRILVALGGGDTLPIVLKVLRAIRRTQLPAEVDVVLGGATAASAELLSLAGNPGPRIRIHGAVEDMAGLMLQADLAIGAAGISAWERCALGLPSIVLQIADNQQLVAESLAQSGAAVFLGRVEDIGEVQLAGQIARIAADADALAGIAERAAAVCDCRGAQRTMLALLQPEADREGAAVTLRLAEAADEYLVLGWQRHPATRRFARNPAIPGAAEHHLWMSAKLADTDCLFTIICCGNRPAGMLRLEVSGAADASREISILVAPELQRRGIGACSLALARQLLPGIELVAEVLPDNVGSCKMFVLAGYQQGEDRLYRSRPSIATGQLS